MKSEQIEQCCKHIHGSGLLDRGHTCTRRAKVSHDGKPYCGQHDPDAVAARLEAKHERHVAYWAKESGRIRVANAAPDLLAALKALVDEYTGITPSTLQSQDALQTARAAIEKAEGKR